MERDNYHNDAPTEPSYFFSVTENEVGQRLDRFISENVREASRTFLQRMIRQGNVSLNGHVGKPSTTLKLDDKIILTIVEEPPQDLTPYPEDIPLEVLWEDADILVVNKPSGMATHTSFGHTSGTLVNALLGRSCNLSSIAGVERPGIVHRLDLDTSGAIVIAKNDEAHLNLKAQFKDRVTRKEYRCIVHGTPRPAADSITLAIGRHPRDHKRMTTMPDGKHAHTEFRTIQSFGKWSYLGVQIHTGRTHQIRVHLKSQGHPVLADALYGREVEADSMYLQTGRAGGVGEPLIARQALHAMRLSFKHPATGLMVGYEAPIPPDMQRVLDFLAVSM